MSPVIACSAILFDLDGVLIDSTPAVSRVWSQWAREHGFNPDEVVRVAHGRPSIVTVREYLPQADHVLENREVERREATDLDGVVALPGACDLLNSLPPDRWAIVTSCTRLLAEVRLKAAGLPRPEFLITADDITNGKPHPEPYLLGAKSLGVSAADCLVFEDVPAGIHAGKAAGARVVGLGTTFNEQELKKAGADWVLQNCSGVTLLNRNSNSCLRLELMQTSCAVELCSQS